jgi:hypothetical protein
VPPTSDRWRRILTLDSPYALVASGPVVVRALKDRLGSEETVLPELRPAPGEGYCCILVECSDPEGARDRWRLELAIEGLVPQGGCLWALLSRGSEDDSVPWRGVQDLAHRLGLSESLLVELDEEVLALRLVRAGEPLPERPGGGAI